MKIGFCIKSFFLLPLSIALLVGPAFGAQRVDAGPWIATWIASPQASWTSDFILPINKPARLSDTTVRQLARVSVGGHRVRIVLSNAYGKAPVMIGGAHIARSAGKARIEGGSDRPLTFGGSTSVRLLPGAPAISDPVDIDVDALSTLAISLYVSNPSPTDTFHWDARQTAFMARGDQIGALDLTRSETLSTRIYLSSILVDADKHARAVVALGDSITDGNGASMDRNQRWPDALADRLAPRGVAILNAGISGARLLEPGMGDSALGRFERDVIAQPGVETVIVSLGINDISWPGSSFAPEDGPMDPHAIVAGLRQLIAHAHAHSVRIIGATITPFEGALEGTPIKNYYNEDKDRVRMAVNAWIRNSGEFDAVIDFDALLRDPVRPARLLEKYDSGDHLHPGDAGNLAMANAVDAQILFGGIGNQEVNAEAHSRSNQNR